MSHQTECKMDHSTVHNESSGVMGKILTAVLTARHLFHRLDNVVFLEFCLSFTGRKESMKRRTGSLRGRCNFTVVQTTLDHYCSSSMQVLPASISQSKVVCRDALVSQGQSKEETYFPVLCTMSIFYSLFPSSWSESQFVCVAPEKIQCASLSCR